MLEFINNNGVLFSGLFSIFTALVSAIVALLTNSQKNKRDSIKSLKTQISKLEENLARVKEQLSKYQNIEDLEKDIDKSDGTIYIEHLQNGKSREICAYCWETKHIKIPIVSSEMVSEYTHEQYRAAKCQCCGGECYSLSTFPEYFDIEDIESENNNLL